MCLIAIAWRIRDDWPLLLAANRDEFHARAAAPAARQMHGYIAGRDLAAGGTWLGASENRRFAAVTNFRDPSEPGDRLRSRGALVSGYLSGAQTPADYAREVADAAALYRGFNLLLGDANNLWYVGSRAGAPEALAPGVHGLSNHLLDTPWPKVTQLQARMQAAALLPDPLPSLFDALGDRSIAADESLPDTGIGLLRERALSAAFIVTPGYGTRCSTVLALAPDRGRFIEQTWNPDGTKAARRSIEW